MKFRKTPHSLDRNLLLREAVPGAVLVVALALLAGCASPGHPAPPSLQVPRLVPDLTVSRVGNQVHLHWTTPARATDGVSLAAPILAEICRSTGAPSARSVPTQPLPTQPACSVVGTVPVHPGASDAGDPLPAELSAGPPALLTYRVQLRGSLGKTAGPSAPAFTASGSAPPALAGFRVTDTKPGALLEWTPQPAPAEIVELTRTRISPPPAPAPGAAPTPGRIANPFRPRSEAPAGSSSLTRLSAGAADAGGTLDRTVELGVTYEYTGQRVLTLTLGTHAVELRSAASPALRVSLRNVFPPDAPASLVATPGPGSIDLSWDPGTEPRIAGYRVYRAEPAPGSSTGATGAGKLLTPDLLNTPSYRDLTASSGHTYQYRVTAVDTTGNESAPSNPASETAP